VAFQPILCQKPLKEICCDIEDLEEVLEENQEHLGYLKVVVDLETPEVGLANRVRKICPQTIFVESHYPEAIQTARQNGKVFDPVEEYRSYYQERLGSSLSPFVAK
jgi:exonuclease SbcD